MLGPGTAGVILRGVYKNPATVTTLNFDVDVVSLDGCAQLASDSRNYSFEKQRSGLIRITIANEPNPIVLTMRPDGGLTGPGLIDVKGQIIVGYFTKTHYENGVATGTTSTPDYRPAMGRCVIGSLVAPPNPKPVPASAQSANDAGAIGMLTGVLGTLDARLDESARDDQHGSFFVLRNEDGVVGCVSLDVLGDDAILRALAVDPECRGAGYGWMLADTAVNQARWRGVRRIYLLTETASDFFAAKFGFRVVDRSTLSKQVAASETFTQPGSAQQIAMRLDL